MKKKNQIKRFQKRVDELIRERALQGTIIENGRQAIAQYERAIARWKYLHSQGDAATGSRDFGRGYAKAVNDLDLCLATERDPEKQHPSVRVIDKVELQGVSIDLYGDPHTYIKVLESHEQVSDDANHLVNLTRSGWTIQHPLSCRPNLFTCPVTIAAQNHNWEGDTTALGTFPCAVNNKGILKIDYDAPVAPVQEGPWKSSATYPNAARLAADASPMMVDNEIIEVQPDPDAFTPRRKMKDNPQA